MGTNELIQLINRKQYYKVFDLLKKKDPLNHSIRQLERMHVSGAFRMQPNFDKRLKVLVKRINLN